MNNIIGNAHMETKGPFTFYYVCLATLGTWRIRKMNFSLCISIKRHMFSIFDIQDKGQL